LVSFGAGFESVLDALRPLLPTAPLAWHYRSRDERLVAFSNSRVYGGALTTFPGVFTGDCLRHVVVAQGPGRGQETSVDAEVSKVVDLILEHAREHPRESLGVIALGIKHAERIDTALRTALARLSDVPDGGPTGLAGMPGSGQAGLGQAGLEAFFAEDVPEPFFVKNLERVQGDERDAIILSIGYGKHPDGRMRYQWGPLLRDGGERRLNVAATRAKHRLTVVSSFSGHDVDPDRVTKAGARMLAEYLDYASSGGSAPEASGAMQLDAFEADVRSRLADAGIRVVAQYGVGGYRVDFAATHPQDPGRMVLAIEADGASYRKSGSVRDRDRLRGEHLQRLGWHYHRLWSTNWFRNPDAEVAKIREAYLRAISTIKPDPDEAPPSWPDAARLGATPPGSVPPGTVQPGTIQPGTVQPGTVSPGSVPPGTVRSDAARHGAPAPGRPTPDASQPKAADSGRSLSDASAAGGSRAAAPVASPRQLVGGSGEHAIEPIRRRELPTGSQSPRELS
jgi:very-short-patch-repair endonuclease